MTNQNGWICPKCEAVMAPFHPTCWYCKPKQSNPFEIVESSPELADLLGSANKIISYSQTPYGIPCSHEWALKGDSLRMTTRKCIKCAQEENYNG